MPWINDTPHSSCDPDLRGGKGSASKRLGVKAKKKPKVPPIDAARKRLKAGERLLYARPKNWSWEKSGVRLAAGVAKSLIAFNQLIDLEGGLFEGNPGQVWGWNPEASDE